MTRYSPRTGLPTEYQVGPFDQAHLYLQWGGKLPGGEEWSCGVRLAGTPASAVADAATLIDDCIGPVAALHSTAGLINNAAKLSYVKLNAIGTNGNYMVDTTNETTFADISGGGTGTPRHPNQVALAVSLTTGFSRGRAHRGRFYLPLPQLVDLDANGLVPTSYADTAKTAANTFLGAINGMGASWDMAIFSRKDGGPLHRAVTGVEVGRVLDTQRRRRNRLVENYR
jgi:hypothetical protein